VIVVLRGYGVTVDLVGATFISKAGTTSSTFKTAPDVLVGTFEPPGPTLRLATNGDLCNGKQLTMPTDFTAQDATATHQSAKIASTAAQALKTKMTV
jgi:hypothetical protein